MVEQNIDELEIQLLRDDQLEEDSEMERLMFEGIESEQVQ